MSFTFNPFTINLDAVSKENILDGSAQGQMAFWDATLGKWTYTETSEMFWDDTNKGLSIGTATLGAYTLRVNGKIRADDDIHSGSNNKLDSSGYHIAYGGSPSWTYYDTSGNIYKTELVDDGFRFYNNNYGRTDLFIKESNGNVGIGTDSPLALTHLKKTSSSNIEFLRIEAAATNIGDSPAGQIKFFGSPTNIAGLTFNTGMIYSKFDAGTYSSCRTTIASPTGVNTWTDTLSVINGRVGILNNAPDSPFQVGKTRFDSNGHIGTENITPDATTPAYFRVSSDSDATALKMEVLATTGNYQEVNQIFYAPTTGSTATFNAGKITSGFDANNYSGARMTFSTPTGAGTWTDVLNIKNGQVGIGTASPSTTFQVHTTHYGYPSTTYATTRDNSAFIFSSSITGTQFLVGIGDDGLGNWIQAQHTGGSARNLILNPIGGNVGIGTTTPLAKLHILQTADEDVIRIEDVASDTTPFVINSTGFVGIGTEPTSRKLHVLSSGSFVGEFESSTDNAAIVVSDPTSDFVFGVHNGDLFIDRTASFTSPDDFVIQGTTGNVGIGTDSPGYPLDILSASNLDIRIKTTNTDGQCGFRLVNDAVEWRFYCSGSDDFIIRNVTGSKNIMTVKDQAPENSIMVSDTGVGIGTTTPGATIEAQQTAPLTGLRVRGELGVTDYRYADIGISDFGRLEFSGSFGGLVEFGNSFMIFPDQYGLRLGNNGDVKMYYDEATLDMAVWTDLLDNVLMGVKDLGTTGRLYVSGDLGIGTTTPSEQLEITGNFEIPTTTSTVGQIKQNGVNLLHTFGTDNLFIGNSAGNFTTSETGRNIGIGYQTGLDLTTGFNNVILGFQSGSNITEGASNMLIGYRAGQNITTGLGNVAIGTEALNSNISSQSNIAIGGGCLQKTTGGFNTGIGKEAGRFTANSDHNVLIGYQAGYGVNGTSEYEHNTVIGTFGGYSLTTGGSNIFLGNYAGYRQTTNSDLLIVDNQQRADVATEATNAILYGTMAATPASQTLKINAATDIEGKLYSTPDEITATSEGVAASLDTINTEVTTNGDSDLDNVTLANGTSGQIKHIYCVALTAGDTWKITPATMCGGTQITFSAVGQGCTLVYADNEGWVVTANNGGTIT